MIDYVQHTNPHAKIDTRRSRGIGWGRGEVATSYAFYFFKFLERAYRAVHRTWLDAQRTSKLVGRKYIPRLSFRFKSQPPPLYPQNPLSWEQHQHKPIENVFAYILTTGIAMITQDDRNYCKKKLSSSHCFLRTTFTNSQISNSKYHKRWLPKCHRAAK